MNQREFLYQKFLELSSELKVAHQFCSSLGVDRDHPSYQKIIDLGYPMVEFLIQDMKDTGYPWYSALTQLTGKDPITKNNWGDIRAMNNQWIAWYDKKETLTK